MTEERSSTSDPPVITHAGQPAFRAGHIALVGRPNVGKSTLLNALLGEPIAITSPQPQTTRDQIRGIVTTERAQFVFVDTPGLHQSRSKLGARMNEAAKAASTSSELVVVVVDLGHGEPSLADADFKLIEEMSAEFKTIVVVNKIDLIKEKVKLLPILERLSVLSQVVAVIPLSARRTDGLDRLLAEIEPHLPESPPLFETDALSDKPVRFFVAEFVREQILRKTRQEIPHGVATVVERFDDSGPVVHIDVVIHTLRESHKKILIGKGGELLKQVGTDARARVEGMLDRKVFLKLFVRVTPAWQDSDALLTELGYSKVEST
jgi:GTP-binding protein Era